MGDHRLGHKTYEMSLKHLIVKTCKDNCEAVQDPRGHVKGTQPPWSSSQEPKTAVTLNCDDCDGLEYTYQVCPNQELVHHVLSDPNDSRWRLTKGKSEGFPLPFLYRPDPKQTKQLMRGGFSLWRMAANKHRGNTYTGMLLATPEGVMAISIVTSGCSEKRGESPGLPRGGPSTYL